MEVLQHMESTLKLYVYGGKLVKLLKKYDEMFSKDFTVSSNKFAYEIEFWGTGQAVYCLDNKGELVHLLTEFLREMVQVYEHNFDLEKINAFLEEINQHEQEILDTVKKIKWDYQWEEAIVDVDDLEQYVDFDYERDEIVEERGNITSDDVSDDEVMDRVKAFYNYLSYREHYFYDKYTAQETGYISQDFT